MKGLGRAPVLAALGIAVVIGCGGRTGTLEADYGEGAGASGTSVAGSNVGGNHAGTSHGGYGGYVAGHGGVGGAYPGGYGGYIGGAYPGGYGGYIGGAHPGGYGGTIIYGGYGGYVGGYGGGVVGGYAGAPPEDCLTCLKESCTPELLACFQDFGCLSIFGCMQATGCQAFQCYTDQYCKGVIDQWGGPNSKPMTELLQTFTCAFQSGCQCG